MTRYRAEYFESGSWHVVGTFDTMTEAEIALLTDPDAFFYKTRCVPIEDPKP